MKILIADDSAILRGRVRERLESIGNIEITGEVSSGTEVMNHVNGALPDLVILDIRMPGMSGIEVLGKIKERYPQIVVCILTSFPSRQYKTRCLDGGADYFFDKSHDIQVMLDTIQGMAG
jgi:DNA-binding NarL/FixJ family response regulator